tara:strand:+ start:4097 stop:6994 length:2898 start_codon:yes stop_codon:yes gene_type:complete
LFVGRKEITLSIEEHWSSSSGACVILEGHAGVGKSAFIKHFIATQNPTIYHLQATGHPYPTQLSFAPFLDAIDDFFAQAAPQDVHDWCKDLHELSPWFPELALPTPPPTQDAHIEQSRQIRTFGLLIERIASQRPTILVFEDLHWMDQASQTLFQYLTQRLKHTQLLIFATLRTEEVTTHTPLYTTLLSLKRLPHVHAITLNPLDKREQKMLAEQQLGGKLSDELHTLLWQQAKGSPLFVRSLLHALQEEQQLSFLHHRWDITTEHCPFPSSIRALVSQRLATLPEDSLPLLSVLAISHQPLSTDTIAQLSSRSTYDTEARLTHLYNAGILEREQTQTTQQYSWHHPLFRQGILDRLTEQTRKQLHKSIACWLAQNPNTPPAQIAFHYQKLDGSSFNQPMFERLQKIAQVYKQQQHLKEAEHLLRLSIEAGQRLHIDLSTELLLYKQLAECLFLQGAIDEAIEIYERLLQTCEHNNMQLHQAQTLRLLAQARWSQMMFQESIAHLELGCKLLEETTHQELQKRIILDQMVLLDRSHQFQRLRTLQSQHNELLQTSTLSERMVSDLIEFGFMMREGRLHKAKTLAETLSTSASPFYHPIEWVRTRNFMGLADIAMGACKAAVENTTHTLHHIRNKGISWCEPSALGVTGVAYLVWGQLDRAMECAEQAITLCLQTGESRYLLRMLSLKSIVESSLGQWDAAEKTIKQAKDLLPKQVDDIHMLASLCLAEASYGNESQQHTQALHALSQLPQEQEIALDSTLPTLLLIQWGELYARTNQPHKLAKVLQRSKVFADCSLYTHAWHAYFRGWAHLMDGDTTKALSSIQQAISSFSQTGHDVNEVKARLCRLEWHTQGHLSPNQTVQKDRQRCLHVFQEKGIQHLLDKTKHLANTLSPQHPDLQLSKREREVLTLLSRGLTNKEIAQALSISHHTVGTYLKRMYTRFQQHNRVALTQFAKQHALLENEPL